MFLKFLLIIFSVFMNIQISSKEPIVTAKKLLEHKRAYGHLAILKHLRPFLSAINPPRW